MAKMADLFRNAVTDQVTTRIAIESRAGFPQGLTNRRFEDITAELIMADWDTLSETLSVEQCIARMCGMENKR